MSGSPLAAAVWLHAVVARVISLMRMLVVVKVGKLIVLWDLHCRCRKRRDEE